MSSVGCRLYPDSFLPGKKRGSAEVREVENGARKTLFEKVERRICQNDVVKVF